MRRLEGLAHDLRHLAEELAEFDATHPDADIDLHKIAMQVHDIGEALTAEPGDDR